MGVQFVKYLQNSGGANTRGAILFVPEGVGFRSPDVRTFQVRVWILEVRGVFGETKVCLG